MLTLGQKRYISIRTARWLMRDWAQFGGAQNALCALDDYARMHPDTVAAQWYLSATVNQEKLFRKEWKALHEK